MCAIAWAIPITKPRRPCDDGAIAEPLAGVHHIILYIRFEAVAAASSSLLSPVMELEQASIIKF